MAGRAPCVFLFWAPTGWRISTGCNILRQLRKNTWSDLCHVLFFDYFFSRPHSETLLFLKIKNGWRRVFWHRQHDPVAIRDCHMQVVTAGLLWSELNFARVQRMFPRSHRETNLKGWSGNVFAGGAAELFDCTRSHLSFHPLQRQTHHYTYIEK